MHARVGFHRRHTGPHVLLLSHDTRGSKNRVVFHSAGQLSLGDICGPSPLLNTENSSDSHDVPHTHQIKSHTNKRAVCVCHGGHRAAKVHVMILKPLTFLCFDM